MTENTSPSAKRRRGRSTTLLAASLLVGVLVLGAACSKSQPNTTASTSPSTTSSSGGTQATTGGTSTGGTTTGTGKATASLNGKKVWFHGFRFDLGDVQYSSEEQKLSIKTKVTNLGSETFPPSPPAALIKGGEQIATGQLKEQPAITGGKTVDDEFNFWALESFTPEGTTFVLTDGSEYQEVKVPLDGKGESVTLEPIEQKEAVKPISLGNVTITPTKVEIRYDLPNNHGFEAPAGKAVFMITATTKNEGTQQITYEDQGITVTTEAGTYPSQFVSDQTVPAKQSDDKTVFYFEIKWPAEGEWTLDVKDQPFGNDYAVVSAESQKVKVSNKQSGSTGTTR